MTMTLIKALNRYSDISPVLDIHIEEWEMPCPFVPLLRINYLQKNTTQRYGVLWFRGDFQQWMESGLPPIYEKECELLEEERSIASGPIFL